MFDQLKQLAQLKKLHDSIQKEIVEVEKQGVKVTMRGDLEVLSITLNPELDITILEKLIMECLAEARGKIQASMAKNLGGGGLF